MIDEQTPQQAYPLPNAGNTLEHDVVRLRAALNAIDANMGSVLATVAAIQTPSAAALLATLKTVDGAASGLDADLLDGQHAAAFAAVGHDHAGVYALVGHNHNGVYAPVAHRHDDLYAPVAHTHDYAAITNAPKRGYFYFLRG